MSSAAEIAAKLTKAQREAFRHARKNLVGAWIIPAIKRGDPPMPTIEALGRKGLGEVWYGCRVLALNAVGLEVREHLQENPDNAL